MTPSDRPSAAAAGGGWQSSGYSCIAYSQSHAGRGRECAGVGVCWSGVPFALASSTRHGYRRTNLTPPETFLLSLPPDLLGKKVTNDGPEL